MKPGALAWVAVLCAFGTTTVAEPCVSDTFERPLPEAKSVVSHVSDVPSVQFPAFWQEGILQGFRYKMLASGEGAVRPINPQEDWVVSITCDAFSLTCDYSVEGPAPQAAIAVSNSVGQCLIGAEVAGVETTSVEPLQDVSETDETTCGSASINETNEVAVMQRLLTIAGEDPGPVDGLLGQRTFSAMEPFVQGADGNTSILDMIALLDARLCASTD